VIPEQLRHNLYLLGEISESGHREWTNHLNFHQTSSYPNPDQILPHSSNTSNLRHPLTSRESEAAYLEKLNEGIAKGTSWERVTEMIQLENSRKSKPGRQPTSFSLLPPSRHTFLYVLIYHTPSHARARAPSSLCSLRSQSADNQNPKPSDPLSPVDQTWQE
jgi:hypothetical protein